MAVFFLDAPGDGTNSDHSLVDATCADAGSDAGRVCGSGDEGRPARWFLAPLPATWFSQVVKSCAIADRGGGAPLGALLAASCEYAARLERSTESAGPRESFGLRFRAP